MRTLIVPSDCYATEPPGQITSWLDLERNRHCWLLEISDEGVALADRQRWDAAVSGVVEALRELTDTANAMVASP